MIQWRLVSFPYIILERYSHSTSYQSVRAETKTGKVCTWCGQEEGRVST